MTGPVILWHKRFREGPPVASQARVCAPRVHKTSNCLWGLGAGYVMTRTAAFRGKSPGASQDRICAAWMHKQPGIALWPERFRQGQRGPAAFRLCNLVAQGPRDTEEKFERGSREGTDWARNRSDDRPNPSRRDAGARRCRGLQARRKGPRSCSAWSPSRRPGSNTHDLGGIDVALHFHRGVGRARWQKRRHENPILAIFRQVDQASVIT